MMIYGMAYDRITEANKRSLTEARSMRHQAEAVGAESLLVRLIARQVSGLRYCIRNFDPLDFIKGSGIEDDWMRDRILGWAEEFSKDSEL